MLNAGDRVMVLGVPVKRIGKVSFGPPAIVGDIPVLFPDGAIYYYNASELAQLPYPKE
jgi:hypothetical protein